MKERPILLLSHEVRAILAGTQTQVRRVVKWPANWSGSFEHLRPEAAAILNSGATAIGLRCPYGQPGDRLWVREAWRVSAPCNGLPPRDISPREVHYEADSEQRWPAYSGKVRPGMFMPRWASRITLQVTGVRVERLQDISEADAQAEGIEELPLQEGEPGAWWTGWREKGAPLHGRTPQYAYRRLWESINDPGSWAANPWVWALTFKRI